MENEENIAMMKKWLCKWGLKSTDGRKVLGISQSKMSEYSNGVHKIPRYIAYHIETLNNLSESKAKKIIRNRLE